MSEQTPDTTSDLEAGLGDGIGGADAEPSMEDILASIRKIIADDADPVPLDGPEADYSQIAPVNIDVDRAEPVATPSEAISDLIPDLTPGMDPGDSPNQLNEAVPVNEDFDPQADLDRVLSDALGDDALGTLGAMPEAETRAQTSVNTDNGLDASDAESDLDIESLLADLEITEPEMPPQADVDVAAAEAVNVVDVGALETAAADADFDDLLDLDDLALEIPEPEPEIPLAETLAVDDVVGSEASIAMEADPIAEMAQSAASLNPVTPAVTALGASAAASMLVGSGDKSEPESHGALDPLEDDQTDELDLLMADLLSPDEDQGELAADSLPSASGDDEMDLVKSLIDDLTDEDLVTEEVSTSADVTAVEAIDENIDQTSAIEAELLAEDEGDILDEILDMTLEDEIADQPLDIAEAEVDPLAQMAEEFDGPDLSEIAALADADADRAASDASAIPALTGLAALGGAAVVGSAASADDQSETSDTEIQSVAADPEPVQDSYAPLQPAAVASSDDETLIVADPTHTDPINPVETSTMPQAAAQPNTDAIIDEVTETATMSAFAELNQVVEDKAVYAERGPRIGDLVQEALKPMLKDWLDENLKGIVERAVAKEVKRISSGK